MADGRRRRVGRDDREGVGGRGRGCGQGREVGVGRAVGGRDVVLHAGGRDGACRDVGRVLAAREAHAGGGEAGRAERAVEEGGTGNTCRIGDGRGDGDRVARELAIRDAGVGDGGSRRVARAHGEGVGCGGRGGGEGRGVGPGVGGADVVLDAGGGDAEAGDGARVGGARGERHRDAAVEGVPGGPVEELHSGDARGVGHIGGHRHIRRGGLTVGNGSVDDGRARGVDRLHREGEEAGGRGTRLLRNIRGAVRGLDVVVDARRNDADARDEPLVGCAGDEREGCGREGVGGARGAVPDLDRRDAARVDHACGHGNRRAGNLVVGDRRMGDGGRRRVARANCEGVERRRCAARQLADLCDGRGVGRLEVVGDAGAGDDEGRDLGGPEVTAHAAHRDGAEARAAAGLEIERGGGNARCVGDGRRDGHGGAGDLPIRNGRVGDDGRLQIACDREAVEGRGRRGGQRRGVLCRGVVGRLNPVLHAGRDDGRGGDGARVGGAARVGHDGEAEGGGADGAVGDDRCADARRVGDAGGHRHCDRDRLSARELGVEDERAGHIVGREDMGDGGIASRQPLVVGDRDRDEVVSTRGVGVAGRGKS